MASLAIRGGSVDVDIERGVITDDTSASTAVLDATGCIVVPGYVDVQINGGFGIDLTSEPERVGELAAALPATGVTSFVPTVPTAAPEVTAHAVDVLSRGGRAVTAGARPIGVHLEGPFLGEARRGAHPAEHLRAPTVREARSWAGITMVTLAPELVGALDVIRELVGRGVVVCVGHTAASAAELDAAFSAGATGATHLFNAMGPFASREPGTVGPLLAHPTAICGLIVDGAHVHPVMVAVAWRALGREQIALVTDGIAALGTGAAMDPTALVGSVVPMDQAVRNLVAFTACSLEDAAYAASTTPARLVRRPDLGRLAAGCAGDVLLLDADGRIVATVVGGDAVFDPEGRLTR